MKFLILMTLMSMPKIASALVYCGPSSCTPTCTSGCTSYHCDSLASYSKTINTIPVTISDESGGTACSFSNDIIDRLPFTVSGPVPTQINQLPVTFSKSYYRCRSQSHSALTCPPP